MPYIRPSLRPRIVDWLADCPEDLDALFGPGMINFIITKLLVQCKPNSYAEYNALVSILESVKLEFYRRSMAAYENEKLKQNGDVYP